ncbi:MAG: hypothetical protein ABR907_02505 [Terracidiphilus sp.]|jgi:hypothetical protein
MKAHILSKVPFLGQFVDERFLEHRRRASSIAGFAATFAALALWEYRLLACNDLSWDLLIVIATFGVVKISMFFWYRFHH